MVVRGWRRSGNCAVLVALRQSLTRDECKDIERFAKMPPAQQDHRPAVIDDRFHSGRLRRGFHARPRFTRDMICGSEPPDNILSAFAPPSKPSAHRGDARCSSNPLSTRTTLDGVPPLRIDISKASLRQLLGVLRRRIVAAWTSVLFPSSLERSHVIRPAASPDLLDLEALRKRVNRNTPVRDVLP